MNLRKENSWQVWPLRIGSLNFAVTKRAGRPSGRQRLVRATAIGNTGKIAVLPRLYRKENAALAAVLRRSCLSKIDGGGPCGHTGRKSIDLCCGSKLEEQLKFVATLLQKKGTVVSTYQA